MNPGIYEALLHEDESSALDFKRDQYEFSGASDEAKAELLKDVLAFANAWRRATAYILIGVQDHKGARSEPVGVACHLEDAALQQFVNGKTQRPVEFAYRTTSLDGVPVGVLEIPVQTRPLYLKKDYGRLRKGVVYVRRGSSTAEAEPDEIARMGLSDSASGDVPLLDIQLGSGKGDPSGHELVLRGEVLVTDGLPHSVPWPRPAGSYGIGIPYDSEYPAKLVRYVHQVHYLREFGIAIANNSGTAAKGAVARMKVPRSDNMMLLVDSDYPEQPSSSPLANIRTVHHTMMELAARNRPTPQLRQLEDSWEIEVAFGTVLPRSHQWAEGLVHIGSHEEREVSISAVIYGENIPDPVSVQLKLQLRPAQRQMTAVDVLPYLER